MNEYLLYKFNDCPYPGIVKLNETKGQIELLEGAYLTEDPTYSANLFGFCGDFVIAALPKYMSLNEVCKLYPEEFI